VVLTTPPRKKFLVTKHQEKDATEVFKKCRTTEEEEEYHLYFICISFKYSTQYFVLKHHKYVFFPSNGKLLIEA
jgi:hypothetical protein